MYLKKPPAKILALTRPMHDLCVKMTTVPEGKGKLNEIFSIKMLLINILCPFSTDLIQKFVDADITQIENVDNRLKCYM